MTPMESDRSKVAIARIDAALARIVAAPARAQANNDSAELAALRLRHERLRSAIQGSLAELDQLIGGAQG